MEDTIAAIATAPGEGGIGVVRISGEKSRAILEQIFSREKNEYFLSLADALSYPDPEEILQQFFSDTFATVAREENWPNLDWFTRPLPNM